jgi:hypothetical protein
VRWNPISHRARSRRWIGPIVPRRMMGTPYARSPRTMRPR